MLHVGKLPFYLLTRNQNVFFFCSIERKFLQTETVISELKNNCPTADRNKSPTGGYSAHTG